MNQDWGDKMFRGSGVGTPIRPPSQPSILLLCGNKYSGSFQKNNSDDGVYNVYNGQGSLDKMMEIHSWNGDE